MKIEDWELALKQWQDFYTQMLIDVEKTEFYIKALNEKIVELKKNIEVKNGE